MKWRGLTRQYMGLGGSQDIELPFSMPLHRNDWGTLV